ncbi:hypothetical protein GW17_00004136 [Ensete ventricosum]|nr:hypothetical protein GW17_00004136 [Ensete ventricosum]
MVPTAQTLTRFPLPGTPPPADKSDRGKAKETLGLRSKGGSPAVYRGGAERYGGRIGRRRGTGWRVGRRSASISNGADRQKPNRTFRPGSVHRGGSWSSPAALTISSNTLTARVGHSGTAKMVWNFPPTPKQLAATAGVFGLGVVLIAVGSNLSYANIAPQQARAEARRQFFKEYLRKKFDH